MSEETLTLLLTVYDHVSSALRDMWQSLKAMLTNMARALSPYQQRHKRRSSRRLSVQATRRRLGLTSWGTIEGSRASRKACYAYARRKERILAHV